LPRTILVCDSLEFDEFPVELLDLANCSLTVKQAGLLVPRAGRAPPLQRPSRMLDLPRFLRELARDPR
jgi:hypothetical protein